jgi:AAA family ATP:ADP antiporter
MSSEHAHVTRLVRLSSITIGVIVATHTLLETARDTLFLERIPISELPWMYLGVAALSMFLAAVPFFRNVSPRTALPLLLFGAGGGTGVFWGLAASPNHALYYALYIWTALCGATVITQFWATMARIFTLGEAKRLFPSIAIGAVVGSALGAGLARALFFAATARTLVLVASIGFIMAAVLTTFQRPPHQAKAKPAPREDGDVPIARVVWKSSYLVAVGQLAFATAITAMVVDYAFKRSLVRHVGADQIGPIVATVAFAANAVGGVIQIFFVPRILAAVGTARSLRLLPGILMVGALAGIAFPHVLVTVGLRSIDGVLRYSLQRTATELLFVPVSEAIRARVKTVLDVVAQRGGQAVASLALLAIPVVLHTRLLLLAVAACSGVWLWLAVRIRSRYLALFRSMVQEGALQELEAMPALDQSSIEVLVAGLSNERDEEVVFALDILAERGKSKLIPTLILFHPSPTVVVRALEVFARYQRRDTVGLTWKLITHHDPNVRVQAVHTACALAFDEVRVRALVSQADGLVGATALVELWARGAERPEEVARVDELLSPAGDPAAQRALLRALSTVRSRRLLLAALPLTGRAPVDVQLEIANAVAADPLPEAIEVLLPMLVHWTTRDASRRALVAIGKPALDELVRMVHDDATSPVLRVHVPRSISRFAPDTAVPILLELLVRHPEGVVRYKALRGLGRLATEGAAVHVDDVTFARLVGRDGDWTSRTIDWIERLRRSPIPTTRAARDAQKLLNDLLVEKGGHAVERIFRVIALRYRGENWERIFQGFRGGRWDESRELLEGLLREPLRGRMLAVVDLAAERRRADPPTEHDEPLAPLLLDLATAEDHVLSSVAAYYAKVMGVSLKLSDKGVPDALRRAS